jgi:hypothetical protein
MNEKITGITITVYDSFSRWQKVRWKWKRFWFWARNIKDEDFEIEIPPLPDDKKSILII